MDAPTRGASVLLVEDHEALRRFVSLALQPLGLALHESATVAAAEDWIAAQGVPGLLITDLMLPDGSGVDLVRRLRARGHRPGQLPVLVMSAGVQAAQREALAALSVVRILTKPVAMADLLASVTEALSAHTPPAPPAADAGREAVARHFGGDQALYDGFRAGCLVQFPADIADGDAALSRGDAAALRRAAHSLKSVLALLGDDAGQAMAAGVEHAAAAGRLEPTRWAALATRLAVLVRHASARDAPGGTQ